MNEVNLILNMNNYNFVQAESLYLDFVYYFINDFNLKIWDYI